MTASGARIRPDGHWHNAALVEFRIFRSEHRGVQIHVRLGQASCFAGTQSGTVGDKQECPKGLGIELGATSAATACGIEQAAQFLTGEHEGRLDPPVAAAPYPAAAWEHCSHDLGSVRTCRTRLSIGLSLIGRRSVSCQGNRTSPACPATASCGSLSQTDRIRCAGFCPDAVPVNIEASLSKVPEKTLRIAPMLTATKSSA